MINVILTPAPARACSLWFESAMPLVLVVAWIIFALPLCAAPLAAGEPASDAAVRAVYLDHAGVGRWRDSHQEVALYGANYCLMSGSDYRMAGLVAADRKA